MNPSRFDSLTRNTSRRQAIKGLAAATFGATLSLSGIGTALATDPNFAAWDPR